MAAAGLDRCTHNHIDGSRAQHLCAQPDRTQRGQMGQMLSPDMTIAAEAVTKAKIEVKNLNFYYGQSKALKDITLSLPERSVTAFIGPSGCGKSTLLRVFNRIYELYPKQTAEGQVLLDGQNILDRSQDLNLLRTKIGMVFQMPIYENIAFGVRLYEKISKAEMDGRVEQALKRAALWTEVKDKLNASGL